MSCRRALGTVEVLTSLFGLTGRKSNIQNALVCKIWATYAIPRIWGRVDLSVFRALRGTVVTESGVVVSSRPLACWYKDPDEVVEACFRSRSI